MILWHVLEMAGHGFLSFGCRDLALPCNALTIRSRKLLIVAAEGIAIVASLSGMPEEVESAKLLLQI